MLDPSRDKSEGAHRSTGGGYLLCDPGSELRKGGSWRSRAKRIDGIEKIDEIKMEWDLYFASIAHSLILYKYFSLYMHCSPPFSAAFIDRSKVAARSTKAGLLVCIT